MNNNLYSLKPVGSLNPFGKFCCTIGQLPSSYMISLTYEEQLLWLCNYLENTVIPAVNQNAEAVAELQELYIKLKSYVDNYFNNLDVQNEINNKLDEMAKDGTLETIIENFLIQPFNNTLFVGDSYILGRHASISGIKGFANIIIDSFNLKNCYVFGQSGGGFANTPPGGYNFLDYVKNHINEIQDTSAIQNIVVCAGYNDWNHTNSEIDTAIYQFYLYCKQTFPSAKIFIGMIGNNSANNTNGYERRNGLYLQTLTGYKACKKYGCIYLNGVENLLKNYGLYDDTDNVHPNQNGQYQLAYAIWQALNSGIYEDFYPNNSGKMTHDNLLDTSTFSFSISRKSDFTKLFFNSGRLNYQNPVDITNNRMPLGTYDISLYRSTLGNVNVVCHFQVNNLQVIPRHF